MKTAKEWAEYLPLDIKLWFIEECERQGCDFKSKFSRLCHAIYNEIDWDKAKLIDDFWYIVWQITLDYKGREEQILTDLEWIDEIELKSDNLVTPIWDKLVVVPTDKKSLDGSKSKPLIIDEMGQSEFMGNSEATTATLEVVEKTGVLLDEPHASKATILALKSTIEGMDAFIKTQKLEIDEQAERLNVKDNTIKALVKQLADVKLDIINLENNNHELLEQIKPTKPTLLDRFLNWFKG